MGNVREADDMKIAQPFRVCVKTRVRTRSGSDGILTIRRDLMIRSLPLSVLTQTL